MNLFKTEIGLNKFLFEGNLERCTHLYRALSGNQVMKANHEYSFSWRDAAAIASFAYGGENESIEYFFKQGKEGIVSKEITDVLNGFGWEIEIL